MTTATLLHRKKPDGSPHLLAYDDAKAWLTDWLAWRTEDRAARGLPPYTVSMLAARAGVRASRITFALTGRGRRPSVKLLAALGPALGLDPVEQRYLVLLARLERVEDRAARARLLREKMALPGVFEARGAEAGALRAATSVLHYAVLELARHPDFRPDGATVARLTGLDPDVAARIVGDLAAAGLLDGPPTDPYLLVKDGAARDARYALQLDGLRAIDAALGAQPDDCAVEGVSLLVAPEDLPALQEGVQALMEELWTRFAAHQTGPVEGEQRPFLVGLHVVPFTRPPAARGAP